MDLIISSLEGKYAYGFAYSISYPSGYVFAFFSAIYNLDLLLGDLYILPRRAP